MSITETDKLNNKLFNAAEVLDETLYALRSLTCSTNTQAQLEPVIAQVEEELDNITWEPRDVREQDAARPLGYESYGPMLPEQAHYTFLLGLEEAASPAVVTALLDIENNSGLTSEIGMSGGTDMRGIPYVEIVVYRA